MNMNRIVGKCIRLLIDLLLETLIYLFFVNNWIDKEMSIRFKEVKRNDVGIFLEELIMGYELTLIGCDWYCFDIVQGIC